jgi:TRAP-type mannitol/chloroaromatic compound transport system permease small subunit
MHINMILPPAYLMLQLFINGVGDGWRTEDSVSGSGANNAWVLIAVVNVTFTLVM